MIKFAQKTKEEEVELGLFLLRKLKYFDAPHQVQKQENEILTIYQMFIKNGSQYKEPKTTLFRCPWTQRLSSECFLAFKSNEDISFQHAAFLSLLCESEEIVCIDAIEKGYVSSLVTKALTLTSRKRELFETTTALFWIGNSIKMNIELMKIFKKEVSPLMSMISEDECFWHVDILNPLFFR